MKRNDNTPLHTVGDMTETPGRLPPALAKVRDQLEAALSIDGGTKEFDLDMWLQGWLRTPQAALGGSRPMDLLQSEDGTEQVVRLLGSMMSGAYQ